MTLMDRSPRSRGAVRPRFAQNFRALKIRGRGECRMRAAPAVSCAKSRRRTHTSIQVQRRHSDIPCAMVLRLTSRSPRRIGLVCLRRLRIWRIRARSGRHASEDLTPTIEASGPHDFTVRGQHRSSARRPIAHGPLAKPALRSFFTPDAAASTASRPASLTIRIRPSVGQDGGGYAGDLGAASREISDFPKFLQAAARADIA
jgi:hypothetical protein